MKIHFGEFEKRINVGLKNNNLVLELRGIHINLYKVQTKNIAFKVTDSTILEANLWLNKRFIKILQYGFI